MTHKDHLIITDDTYGIKLLEVTVSDCNLDVFSYVLGRALTLQETLEDEGLMQVLKSSIYNSSEAI